MIFMRYILFLLIGSFTPHNLVWGQITVPTEVNDLVFWVDANDVNANGIQPANGAIITQWADKSGFGNDLTRTDGTITFEATGFDGLNPGLRFPPNANMDGPNPFSGNFQNEMTVFFVNANVTLTNNFALTLNGHNIGNNIADGRFSFHTPWGSNIVFFDAGACCGITRLNEFTPNTLTETTLYTGLNDAPGNSQLLRLDAVTLDSDNTGHNANVSRGIHIGDIPNGHSYNGRFAEILVYERGLSLDEILDVECYLLNKWKPSARPSTCQADITAQKEVSIWDPQNLGLYSIPGNDVIYTINITHSGGITLDNDSIFLTDKLADEIIFFNGDIDDADPATQAVIFTDNASGLSFNSLTNLAFSNLALSPTNMADCTYAPLVGYDPNVRHICFNPSGEFAPGLPNPSFDLSFRAKIR